VNWTSFAKWKKKRKHVDYRKIWRNLELESYGQGHYCWFTNLYKKPPLSVIMLDFMLCHWCCLIYETQKNSCRIKIGCLWNGTSLGYHNYSLKISHSLVSSSQSFLSYFRVLCYCSFILFCRSMHLHPLCKSFKVLYSPLVHTHCAVDPTQICLGYAFWGWLLTECHILMEAVEPKISRKHSGLGWWENKLLELLPFPIIT
jgi:hypothetical protein